MQGEEGSDLLSRVRPCGGIAAGGRAASGRRTRIVALAVVAHRTVTVERVVRAGINLDVDRVTRRAAGFGEAPAWLGGRPVVSLAAQDQQGRDRPVGPGKGDGGSECLPRLARGRPVAVAWRAAGIERDCRRKTLALR